jgi:ethanolaminephosphotransferase
LGPWEQWNAVVKLLPRWLAPNMVTLLGFFAILGNVALLQIYVPDLIGPVRSLQTAKT